MDDLISKLSEIRSDYNCFDEDEEPYYRALSEAIKILSQRADGDTISRKAAMDAICNACGKIDCDKMDKCEKLQLPPANCSEFPNNSDTISRQAAIDALDIAIERYDEMAEEYRKKTDIERNDYMDMRDDAHEARQLAQWLNELKYLRGKIEQLTIKPEPHWIPCGERLPEYNESVLTWDGYVFCIEKRIPYIRDDDGEPIEGDWWVSDEYDEYESEFYPNLRDGAAIAWMPLPEPYEGGDSE